MKAMILAASVLVSALAQASTLNCWDTRFSAKTPMLSAYVVDDQTLTNITFNYKNSFKNVTHQVHGKVENSPRSPYQGDVKYDLVDATLILPPDLSASALDKIYKIGFSRIYKNENGAIIYDNGKDDGGSHDRFGLRCEAN